MYLSAKNDQYVHIRVRDVEGLWSIAIPKEPVGIVQV